MPCATSCWSCNARSARPRSRPTDRAILAGLLHHLPTDKLRHLLLLVHPDTILRWHRDLLKRRHAATCVPKRRGRPPTIRSIRALVLRLASENASWGYRRIHGELAALGINVAASTVWEILKDHGIPPAPERQSTTWADFLRSQADALLACDLFQTRTLTGARLYVFTCIEHSTRRIRILGATAHPTAEWIVQLGRNLLMDLEDASSRARFLIRDRDSKFTAAFDALLSDAGLKVVTTGIQIPRMNSLMERWIQTCRHELLDRTLIWNQATSSTHSASSRPSTTAIARTEPSAKPRRSDHYPNRSACQRRSNTSRSADAIDSAKPFTSTDMPPDQAG